MNYHVEFDVDFLRNTYPGKYIAFEGIDGSGKTTQAEKLAAFFKEKGKEVVLTREPRKDEGVVGKMIFEILKGNMNVPSHALQYLFTAERIMHYEELILPSIKEGKVVISDRCFWSAIPYGMLDRMKGKNYDFSDGKVILVAQSILSMYHEFMIPDVTFYLDVLASIGLKRADDSERQKEIYETGEKLDKIRLGYDWLLKEFPKEILRIDGSKAEEEVTEQIVSKLT